MHLFVKPAHTQPERLNKALVATQLNHDTRAVVAAARARRISAHLEYAPRNSMKLAIGSAPFLRRFLRGISCSGALRVVCAFFPRKLHLRSHGSTSSIALLGQDRLATRPTSAHFRCRIRACFLLKPLDHQLQLAIIRRRFRQLKYCHMSHECNRLQHTVQDISSIYISCCRRYKVVRLSFISVLNLR